MSSLRWHARASSSPSTISAWPYWKRTEGSPSFRRRNDEARDALPGRRRLLAEWPLCGGLAGLGRNEPCLLFEAGRSEEHTSELQSRFDLVCRLLLEKKTKK